MPKKIPLRQCAGCREMKPKRELIRIVRSPEGAISLDRTGKSPGRGVYVCPNTDCMKKARKTKALSRSLGVEIPDEVYEQLESGLEASDG